MPDIFYNDFSAVAPGTSLDQVSGFAASPGQYVVSADHKLRLSSGGAIAASFANPSTADYRVRGKLALGPDTGTWESGNHYAVMQLGGRFNGTGGYTLRYDNALTQQWQIVRYDGSGSQTVLANGPAGITLGTVYAWELELVGTTINAYLNGASTPTMTATDPTYAGPGKAFLANYIQNVALSDTAGPQYDDLGVSAAAPASSGVAVASSDASLVYSPGNWLGGTTINAGATVETLFKSSRYVKIAFDTAGLSGPVPWVVVEVDGGRVFRGPINDSALSAGLDLSAATAWFRHLLIRYEALDGGQARWNRESAVKLSTVTFDAGAAVSPTDSLSGSGLLFGDSIAEGDHTLANTGTYSADNSATAGHARVLGSLLGVRLGVVGFSGLGYVNNNRPGSNVPTLPSSFDKLWQGQARTFDPSLAFVLVAYGTNDGGATDSAVTAAVQSVATGLLAKVGGSTVILMAAPVTGYKASAIQAGVVALNNARVRYVNLAGLAYDTTDGLHPAAGTGLTNLARGVADRVRPLLTTSTASTSSSSSTSLSNSSNEPMIGYPNQSSGDAGKSTNSDAPITLLPAMTSGRRHSVTIVNESTNAGYFSLDGGNNWCRLTPGKQTLNDVGSSEAILVKRVAGGGDVTVYGFASI